MPPVKRIELPIRPDDLFKVIRFFNSKQDELHVSFRNLLTQLKSELQPGGGASSLDELSDVTVSSPAGGDVLTYNNLTGQWENATPSVQLLEVEDEGVSVDASVSVINFVGPGVTVNPISPGVVEVDVSSSGGSSQLNEPTGVLFGGVLSASIGGTTFSLTAGIGQIVTQTSTISGVSTTVTPVSWAAATAVPITNISTAPFTYVLINSTGAIIQQTTPFTDAQYKTHIVIGILCHINLATVNLVTNTQNVAYQDPYRLVELIRLFGPIKKTGLTIGPNGANLRVNRASGEVFKIGSNYTTAAFEPDVDTISAVTPAQLCRVYRDGSGGFVFDTNGGLFYTDIAPNLWDNGSGTPQAVPSNRWTVQRLFMFPDNPNDIICYYGIQLYNNFSEARAGVEFEQFDEAQITAENAVFLGFLFVRHNATALNNPSQAAFLQAGLFRGIPPGGGGSGGAGTVTSVGATVPNPVNPAFSVNVTNPTTTPSVDITANGDPTQYVDGEGALRPFPIVPPPESVYPYQRRQYFNLGDGRSLGYYQNKLFIVNNTANQIRVVDTETNTTLLSTILNLANTSQIIDDIATPEHWCTSTGGAVQIARHNAITGAFIANSTPTGVVTSAIQSRFVSFSSTKTIGANLTNVYTINPSTFVTANLTAHGLGTLMVYLAVNKNPSSLHNNLCMVGGQNGIMLFDCVTNTTTLAATNLGGVLGNVLEVAYDAVNDLWFVATIVSTVFRIIALQPASPTTFNIIYNKSDISSNDFTLTGGNAKQVSLIPIPSLGQLYVCLNNLIYPCSILTGQVVKSVNLISQIGTVRPTNVILDAVNKRMFYVTAGSGNTTVFEIIYDKP
jgi:hypothetical protein